MTIFELKRFLVVVLCGGIALVVSGALPAPETCIQRAIVSEGNQARLAAFFKKALEGKNLTVGVIGGSITNGTACKNPDKRYHGILLAWLKTHFPKSEFKLVNAGIGATNSDYGALRAKRDLLSKKPDLVVIEFAVNDGNDRNFAESYEGLVRQVLNAPGEPTVLLLFMMHYNGKNAQEKQAAVGKHYNLPMISYRDALWPEIETGTLKWKEISPDSVHPNETGHVFAGKLLCLYMDHVLKKYMHGEITDQDSAMPRAMISKLFENCILLEGNDLKPIANKGWTFDKYPPAWKSSIPGSVVEFELAGRTLKFAFWKINGPMGKVKVYVDGNAVGIFDSWFSATWGGHRNMQLLGSNLEPVMHRIKFELLEEKNAGSSGNEFKILCIGAAGAGK